MNDKIKEWLDKAERDLKISKFLYNGKFWEDASLYAQQSAEKALKALYRFKFNTIPKTHDIVMMAKKLSLPEELLDCCDSLNLVYIPARYPEAIIIKPREFSEEFAKNDIKCAEEVLSWVKNQLKNSK